jgi:PAS domain S-box-containing protein
LLSAASHSEFDVESFIHEYYDAWSGTDLDRIMSFYTEDVVLQIPGLLMEGNEAVREQFARPFTTAFPGNRHFIKNMIFGPGVVTVEFSFEAEHKGPFAGHAATGARISLSGCGVYEYESATRQITAGRIYFDVGTLLQTITDALVDDRQDSEEALRTNERNLSLITNVIPTFIHVLHSDGSVLYVNQPVLGYTGLTLEDVRKEEYRARIFHPDDIARLREESAEALRRPVPFENEQRVLGKDGKYRWFLIRYNPLLDAQGKIDRWYVAAFDIEDRKRAEEALVRQAGVRADVSGAFSKPIHLGEILRGCAEAIVRNLDAAFARIWTLSKDESMLELQASAGMYTRLDGSYSRIPVGDLKVGLIAREKKAHLTNDVMNDSRVHDKDWAQDNGMVAFAGYPLLVEDRLIGVVALFARRTLSESILDTLASVADTIAQGIERKRAEEALRNALDEIQKSESKLRQVIDTIPALAWCNLPDGPNEFLSKGWHEYTGLSEEESYGWGWQAAFHPDDLPPLMEKWMKMLTSGEPDAIEARLRRHDGVYRWFLIRAEPFRDDSGKILRWYGTSTDIDDRKKAEEALQASERNLTVMINVIPALIHTARPDGYLDYFNHRWLDYLGCSLVDVEGWNWTTWIHPDDVDGIVDKWQACLASGDIFEYETRVRRSDGQYRWMFHRKVPLRDEHGNIVRWYGTSFDIEDRKRAEEGAHRSEQALTMARSELAHMARVTTLSAMTASIAHEINQPIAAVTTSADACLRWLNRDQPEVQRAREAAMRIEEDGKRAAEIITHLKSFYKKDVSPQREMVSVNDLVAEMFVLLHSEADRHSVVMRTDLAADLPSVNADRVLLQQVLMNLMQNGREAMSERGGELKISTRCEGRDVVVSVSDTGVGIPPDKMEEIFEAFFTTKCGGTGMGLAISNTIIESHGGRLWATENPRRGATFHFTLPIEPSGISDH